MIDLSFLADKRVMVMGLGRSGLATAEALLASNLSVIAFDDEEEQRITAIGQNIPLVDPEKCDWDKIDMMVLSPGIPLTHPVPHPTVEMAKRAGVEIVSDIELLRRADSTALTVAITGTNGKSTTTALLAHILREAGLVVAIGGNFGPPALSLTSPGDAGVYVLELSSYQLDLTPHLCPTVAVLLNISPDHLERHGNMLNYVTTKSRVFDGASYGVIGDDDSWVQSISPAIPSKRLTKISATHRLEQGVVLCDRSLMVNDLAVGSFEDLPALPGLHNAQNIAAAYAAASYLAITPSKIMQGIRSFAGLPHRQELVAMVDGIRFINDSKATNADAASRALACYNNIYWIAGGLSKTGGIVSLSPWFDRIRHAHLIGTAAEEFAETLGTSVPVSIDGTLDAALENAYRIALMEGIESPVILLSPAAASFDQFASFEDRGERFRRAVKTLAERRMS